MAAVLGARPELQSRGLLPEERTNPNNVYDLARDIIPSQKFARTLKIEMGYRKEGWPYALGVIGGFFWYTCLVMLSVGLQAFFISFVIGAVAFSPLFYFWRRNALTWDKLLTLHKWAASCEKVISALGLQLDSRLPESINSQGLAGVA
jgi:hypothetical protein